MSYATANERYFASLVNQARKDRGLPPLTLEKRLNDSADAHSRWLLDKDVFSHTGQGGSSLASGSRPRASIWPAVGQRPRISPMSASRARRICAMRSVTCTRT
ncbi:CAP domain-containing protein [Paracoccus aerius]